MARSLDVHPHIGSQRSTIRASEVIRRLAVAQHGVVTRAQLLACGLSASLIDHRVERNQLDVLYRGVYALNRELLSREGRWLAAVMSGGEGAALSHFAAAALWSIRPGDPTLVDVVVRGAPRRRAGVRLHRLPLAADEVTEERGIPVTTPSRAIFDLAASLRIGALARMVRETERLRLDAGPSLSELAERYPGRTGVPRVRDLVAHGWGPTRNEFEDEFLEAIHEAGLSKPRANALVDVPGHRFEVDFLWSAERLVVELDGFETHGTRYAFEADRRRDRLLQLAGFDVFRVTHRDLTRDRAQILRDLARRLSRNRPRDAKVPSVGGDSG